MHFFIKKSHKDLNIGDLIQTKWGDLIYTYIIVGKKQRYNKCQYEYVFDCRNNQGWTGVLHKNTSQINNLLRTSGTSYFPVVK